MASQQEALDVDHVLLKGMGMQGMVEHYMSQDPMTALPCEFNTVLHPTIWRRGLTAGCVEHLTCAGQPINWRCQHVGHRVESMGEVHCQAGLAGVHVRYNRMDAAMPKVPPQDVKDICCLERRPHLQARAC